VEHSCPDHHVSSPGGKLLIYRWLVSSQARKVLQGSRHYRVNGPLCPRLVSGRMHLIPSPVSATRGDSLSWIIKDRCNDFPHEECFATYRQSLAFNVKRLHRTNGGRNARKPNVKSQFCSIFLTPFDYLRRSPRELLSFRENRRKNAAT